MTNFWLEEGEKAHCFGFSLVSCSDSAKFEIEADKVCYEIDSIVSVSRTVSEISLSKSKIWMKAKNKPAFRLFASFEPNFTNF